MSLNILEGSEQVGKKKILFWKNLQRLNSPAWSGSSSQHQGIVKLNNAHKVTRCEA